MADDSNNSNSGRTLGGGAAEPIPAEWANRTSAPRIGRVGGPSTAPRATNSFGSGPRIASLRDVQSSAPPMRGPPPSSHDDDDDDDDDGPGSNEDGETWFAGGERSGLSVENPDKPAGGTGIMREILRKAAQAPRPEEAPSRSSAFGGSGHTLGSDEVDSTYIPDPDARGEEEQETAIRRLTFWKDGFSIEDGALMPYEDENSKRILAALNSGNAPPSLLNVNVDQPVELRVERRTNENYQPPPKRVTPFGGSGNRLGSPAPNLTSSSTAGSSLPGSFPGAPTVPAASGGRPFDDSSVTSIQTRFEVDQSQPTTSVQIRLADGTRLVARMNLTHTVGDIRGFINASQPGSASRAYTIGTTFPNRTLEDDTVTIQSAGLANSVVVQRWA